MIDDMKQSRVGVMVMVAALVASIQGIAAPDCVIADPAVLEDLSSQLSLHTAKKDVANQPLIVAPSIDASSADVRDVPSISGRYSIGGRTLLPYLGAGFSGGYSSEFNRSLNLPPPTQHDFGLRSQFGQSLSPNEFQLGVRIPF